MGLWAEAVLGLSCDLLGHMANVSSTISGTSLSLATPLGAFLKVWPKCHKSLTAAAQVAALPVPQFGQPKISPPEPSALSLWNTNCFPLPWSSQSLTSLHPHLQLTPKHTWDKASRRHSTEIIIPHLNGLQKSFYYKILKCSNYWCGKAFPVGKVLKKMEVLITSIILSG